MKSWFLCFVLISMAVLAVDVLAANIDPGVLDPCKRPGGPYPGCPTNEHSKPANPWTRGCSSITRCRGKSTPRN